MRLRRRVRRRAARWQSAMVTFQLGIWWERSRGRWSAKGPRTDAIPGNRRQRPESAK